MIDLEDMDDIAAEVADIMGNGNLDLSNSNFSVLQEFPDKAEINVPPVTEEKTILVATPQLSAPTVTTKQSVPNTYKTCMIQRMGGYHYPLRIRRLLWIRR